MIKRSVILLLVFLISFSSLSYANNNISALLAEIQAAFDRGDIDLALRNTEELKVLLMSLKGGSRTDSNNTQSDGSRKNPAQIGQMYKVKFDDWMDGKGILHIGLTEVIRGDQAWTIIRNANQFNKAPGPNQEYMLAKFYVKAVELEKEPYDLNHAKFEAVSKNGVAYDDFVAVSIKQNLRSDLYEGAEVRGYTFFLTDKGDSPLLVFERKSKHEIWFEPGK